VGELEPADRQARGEESVFAEADLALACSV
jgi:hypothetical protein